MLHKLNPVADARLTANVAVELAGAPVYKDAPGRLTKLALDLLEIVLELSNVRERRRLLLALDDYRLTLSINQQHVKPCSVLEHSLANLLIRMGKQIILESVWVGSDVVGECSL
ncbi:MAG TPA: hypothetical protein VFD85_09780 [Gemmatimonadales bacterium]|nr:hypothetical protein [Gemmatimonadales bacterium]